jgi:DoxX-like family
MTSSGNFARSRPPPVLRADWHPTAARGYYREVMTAEVIVTSLLAALFGFAALIKLVGLRQSLAIRDHLGVKPVQWRLIGLLELAGVAGVLVGLVWPPIGVAAAIGLALLVLGAIVFHVRASDSVADMAPAVIGLGLAIATAILQSV